MKNLCAGDLWFFDNTQLSSFGVVTELDSYLDIPPVRGNNWTFPFQDGTEWVPKFFGERTVSFGIEVTSESIPDLESKFDALATLCDCRTGQKTLLNASYDGVPRSAWAEVVNQLGVTMGDDPLVRKIVIDFLLNYPLFQAVTPLVHLLKIKSNPFTFTVNNPGVQAKFATVTLAGLSNPVIINQRNQQTVKYNGKLAKDELLTIDCRKQRVTDQSNQIVDHKFTRTDRSFLTLEHGENVITVTENRKKPDGEIKIDFRPAYYH